jgi:nicotinate-nucleotide pyrophosphorylase (carboxylating)
MKNLFFKNLIELAFNEDGVSGNYFYDRSIPTTQVRCTLNIKADCMLAGLPLFMECFQYLGRPISNSAEIINEYEGKKFKKGATISFELPFNIVLTGERIALNFLQHATSISTYVNKHVELVAGTDIKILDTRKTTPGYRSLEKYAVRIGGGHNHRFNQADVWMVKDNHKYFFGGLNEAISFFKDVGAFYNNMVVEIHCIDELKTALEIGINHVMLDNFTPEMIKEAITLKKDGVSFEVSGGLRLDTLSDYIIDGVDAFSIGALTYGAPHIDLSLKYKRI